MIRVGIVVVKMILNLYSTPNIHGKAILMAHTVANPFQMVDKGAHTHTHRVFFFRKYRQ